MPCAWPPGTMIDRHDCWPTPASSAIAPRCAPSATTPSPCCACARRRAGSTALLWSAVGGTPIVNRFARLAELPARTALSDELARALAARGFRFVGPVIVYAYLQSIGVVNDHLLGCFRHPESASGDAAASLGWTGQSNPPLPD